MNNGERHLWKGLVAGAAGRLAAAWAMNQFQTGWSKAAEKLQHSKTPQGEQERQSDDDAEDATMKAAGKISESIFNRELSREEKRNWGRSCTMHLEPAPAQSMAPLPNSSHASPLGPVFRTGQQFSLVPMRSRCRLSASLNLRRSILLRRIYMAWPRTWYTG